MNSNKLEIILSFITGGLIVSLVCYATKYMSPQLGALLWAAPIILLPSIILMYYQKVDNKRIASFIYISIPYLFLTLVFQIIFLLILCQTKLLEKNNGVIIAALLSILLWMGVAYLVYNSNIHKKLTIT